LTELWFTVLVASFVGSLHCAGMCGGLVAFCSGSEGTGTLASRQIAYHGARLLAYATLGGVSGWAGARLDGFGARAGLHHLASAVAGATILIWSATLLVEPARVRHLGLRLPDQVTRAVRALLLRLKSRPPVARAAFLGLASGILPCGWLYAFVLVAGGTGSALAGGSTMAVFWVGTIPALVGVSVGARALAHRLGRRLPALSAFALVVVGATTVISRTTMAPVHGPEDRDDPGKVPVEAPCHGH
jgi:sulfite exporter TauE/SafE